MSKSEIVEEYALRYFDGKTITVGEWNKVVVTLSEVSCVYPGTLSVIRCLCIGGYPYMDRTIKPSWEIDPNVLLIKRKCWRYSDDIWKRFRRMQKYKQDKRVKMYKSMEKAIQECIKINSLSKQIKGAMKNGKDNNSKDQGGTCTVS